MNLSFEGAIYHGFNFRIEQMDKKKFMTVQYWGVMVESVNFLFTTFISLAF